MEQLGYPTGAYEKNGVYGQIVALSVEQEQRGQHIGSSLLAEGERWLHRRGVQTIIVNKGTDHARYTHSYLHQLCPRR
jgi:predicted N-acetyltransferase YhbS